jgi:hypothetical protein
MKLIFLLYVIAYLTNDIRAQGANDTIIVNPPECGFNITSDPIDFTKTKRFLTSKIIRDQKEFGWVVLLLSGEVGFKTGNLINSQWVLTNAQDVEYALSFEIRFDSSFNRMRVHFCLNIQEQ